VGPQRPVDTALTAERKALGRIRVRLTLWYSAVFTLSLLFVGVAVYAAVRYRLMSDVQWQLVESARELAGSEDLRAEVGGPPRVEEEYKSVMTFVLAPDGRLAKADLLIRGLPDQGLFQRALGGSDGFATVRGAPGQVFLVYALPVVSAGRVIAVIEAAAPIAGYEAVLRTLATTFFVAAAAVVSLGALAGLMLAGRALVPIRLSLARQRDFVADASHELRTPLTTIRTSAELALRSGDPGDQREALEQIVHQTEHLTHLVADLSTLARVDSGQPDMAMAPLQLDQLVGRCGDEAQALAQSKGVRLSVRPAGPLAVSGDEQRLRQLLWILLDNAIKYTPAGGEVAVTAERSGDRAVVRVADTGVGIAAAELPRVFDRFFRGEEARRVAPGSGLGLAIARWIVQAHGGSISVSSTPGKGTVFTFSLPLAWKAAWAGRRKLLKTGEV
jgi:two-component system sensor histidine kinase CiaH